MEVTQINGDVGYEMLPAPENAELQAEYNYAFAESLTKKLLEKGLITEEEYGLITARNRKTFSSFMAKIYP